MNEVVSTHKKTTRKQQQSSRIRRMSVRQLRERYAGAPPALLRRAMS